MMTHQHSDEKSVLGEVEVVEQTLSRLRVGQPTPPELPATGIGMKAAALSPLLQPLYQAHCQRLASNPELTQAMAYYVTPDAIPTRYSEARMPLAEVMQAFLSQSKVPLLLLGGESGSGKSVYLNRLDQQCWLALLAGEEGARVSLFIDLKSLYQLPSNVDFVTYHLQGCGYTADTVARLREDYAWVLLLDGYDELSGSLQGTDLYIQGQLTAWSAPVVISCRSEYLNGQFANRFRTAPALALSALSGKEEIPQSHDNTASKPIVGHLQPETYSSAMAIQEYFIAPFSPMQISTYLQQYAATHLKPDEAPVDYETRLEALPSLRALVTSPLILRLVAEVLPKLQTESQDTITLSHVYAAFTECWFERESARLHLTQQVKLPGKAFTAFSRALAFLMFLQGTPEVAYGLDEAPGQTLSAREADAWVLFFSEEHPTVQQLRQGAPLRRLGNGRFSFYHKSFMEYFAASYLYHEILRLDETADDVTQALIENLEALPLNFRLLTTEPVVLRFLAEQVQYSLTKSAHEARLLALAQASKHQPAVGVAAANAVTLLNAARFALSGHDLAHTHLAGSDLSYSLCDHTDFQGANLAGINLTQAWLRGADFSHSNLTGVCFGQRPYFAHEDAVRSIAYRPDGQQLATVEGSEIILWNLATGKRLRQLRGHTGRVTSVSWSPDSRSLASGSEDKTVRVWNVASSNSLLWEGHTKDVTSVSWSQNGGLLASGSEDKTVRIRDLASGEFHIWPTKKGVSSMSWSPDGRSLVCITGKPPGAAVEVLNVSSGESRVLPFSLPMFATSVSWSPTAPAVALGLAVDGMILVWDEEKKDITSIWKGHTHEVTSVSWSSDGRFLASGSKDKTVRVWDIGSSNLRLLKWRCEANSSNEPTSIWRGHTHKVISVSWSPDGRFLASGSKDKTVQLWEAASGKARAWQGHMYDVTSMSWSPDGGMLASSCEGGIVLVWDAVSNKSRLLVRHKERIASMSWSPDGKSLAIGSLGGMYVYTMVSGESRLLMLSFLTPVTSVSWSPDGQSLAVGDGRGSVRAWNMASDKSCRAGDNHWTGVTSISWSPDNRFLASGSWDKEVYIWDATSGKTIHWKKHTEGIKSLSWSPDGRMLASGSVDKTVRVWDVASGESQVCKGHTDKVTSVSWSPDSRSLASGSFDETVRIWDVANGSCLTCLPQCQPITVLAWSSTELAVGTTDGGLKRWRAIPTAAGLQWCLRWSTHIALGCTELRFDGAWGLTEEQQRLLEQRGAHKPSTLPKVVPFMSLPASPPKAPFFRKAVGFVSRRLGSQLPTAKVLPTLVPVSPQMLWLVLGAADALHSAVTALNDYLQLDGQLAVRHPDTGASLLIIAAERGDLDTVQRLLQVGAKRDASDYQQRTALHVAAMAGHWPVLETLLAAGVRANSLDKDGRTPADCLSSHKASEQRSAAAHALAAASQKDQALDEDERKWSLQIRQALDALAQARTPENWAAFEALRHGLAQASLREAARTQLLHRLNQAVPAAAPLRDVDLRLDLQSRLQQLRQSEDPYWHLTIQLRQTLRATPAVVPAVAVQLNYLLSDLEKPPLALLEWPKERTAFEQRLRTATKVPALKVNDASLKPLQARIKTWQQALKTLSKAQAPASIIQSLQALIDRDQAFITTLCQGDIATRQAALTPRLSLITTSGAHYATPEVTQALHRLLVLKAKDNQTGVHDVIQHAGLYFKLEPHEPGAEMAINLLSHLVGVQGTTHTELIKVSYKGNSWPVLVSRAIEGPHFGEYLDSRKKQHDAAALAEVEKTGRLPYEPTGFAQAVLFALWMQPYDGKRDNYIAQAVGDRQAVPVQRKPVGIDNDLALVTPIIRQGNGDHIGQLNCFLLFEPQMTDPIPTEVRQHWQNLSVETLLLSWLQGIQAQEENTRAWVKAGLFTEEELRDIHIPLHFMPGRFAALHRVGSALQAALQDETVLTLNDIFKRVHPLVYAYYQGIREHQMQSGKGFSSEQAYLFLHRQQAAVFRGGRMDGNAPLTLEAIRRDTQDPELQAILQALPSLLQQEGEHGFMDFTEKRALTPAQALAEALPALAEATRQDAACQREVLQELMQWKRLAILDLTGWSTLTDRDLEKLVRQNRKYLKDLVLQNNAALTVVGLKSALELCPSVHFQLGSSTRLSADECSRVMDISEHFSVQLPNGAKLCLKQGGLVQTLTEDERQALAADPFFCELAERQGLSLQRTPGYRL